MDSCQGDVNNCTFDANTASQQGARSSCDCSRAQPVLLVPSATHAEQFGGGKNTEPKAGGPSSAAPPEHSGCQCCGLLRIRPG